MIVVDSSVWIAHFRGIASEPALKLRDVALPSDILVGDLILMEILQGAQSDEHAKWIGRNLRQFEIVRMLDDEVAVEAAGYLSLTSTARHHGPQDNRRNNRDVLHP